MWRIAILLTVVGSLPAAAHDCVKPILPVLPDRATADIAAQNAAVASIDAYVASMNTYLACLESADLAARAEAEALIQSWDAPVDDLEVVVE